MKLQLLLLVLPLLLSCGRGKKDDRITVVRDTNPDVRVSDFLISRIGAPDESPYTVSESIVGVDKVSLSYYSSGAKGRQIFGAVVPYYRPWTISDYIPLRLSTSADFSVGNTPLHAGIYYLYLIPAQDSIWRLVFNSEISIKGSNTDRFDSTKTVAILSVKPERSDRFCENLTVSFRKNEVNEAVPEIAWEYVRIPFELRFDNTEKVFARITQYFNTKKSKQQSVTWDEYMDAAKFTLHSNLKPEQGIKWIDSSIQLNTNFNNLEVKAQLLAAEHQYKDAVVYLEKSYALLKQSGNESSEVGLKTLQDQIDGLKKYISTLKK